MTDKDLYCSITEQIDFITKWLLLELAERVHSKKEIYLRNALAKSLSFLKAINSLYTSESYNEGWVLYRSLLDRYVYILHLCKTDTFNEFEKWSFLRAFEYNSSIRSDEQFKKVLKDPLFEINKEQTKKYYAIKAEQINWVRPNPKSILKSQGLDFLYKYGYEYSSGHTHPTFEDGALEFYKLTGLKPNPFEVIRQEDLIKNSILVNSLIQREVFNNLRFKFRGVIHRYLDETLLKINNEPNEFDINVIEIMKFIEIGVTLYEE